MFNVLLLSVQANHQQGAGFMRKWLLDALAPMEKLVDGGIQGAWNVWDGYVALLGVRDENQQLRAENDRLRMQIQHQDEEIREAERLRAYLGLSESGIGKTVAARVIGRDPSRSLQTVTIDRGESSGIEHNDSVITPDGVVGRVIGTSGHSAVVQLITDAQSEVAALVRDSRIQALFKGTGGRDLELDYIDDDREIAVGDELVTSGLDQIHPKGLPLATVTSVGPRADIFRLIFARPHVDMGRLEEVLVITEPVSPAPEPQDTSSAQLPSD